MAAYHRCITLLEYYNKTRGAGHTTLMNEGLYNYAGKDNAILISRNQVTAESMAKTAMPNRVDPVGMNWLNQLQNLNGPIIFDNGAMITLLQDITTDFDIVRTHANIILKELRGE